MVFEWPKVLVFTITYSGKDYVYDDFKKMSSLIEYPNMRHIWIDNTNDGGVYYKKLLSDGLEAYHVERGNNSREALARSQEFARKMAVNEGYDYILSLESDLFVPQDVIYRLLGRAKDVVGCLYMIGPSDNRIPCITVPKKDEITKITGSRLLKKGEFENYYKKGLVAVNGCGMGCTLISREIFTKIPFTYYPDLKGHSDIFYHNDVWKNGYSVFVDTDIYCDHKNVPWSLVEDR